jgi:hypothetical protein
MEAGEICATLAGVTVGRPFADIDLWEFFLSLPAEIKYPDLNQNTDRNCCGEGTGQDPAPSGQDLFDDFVMSESIFQCCVIIS